MQTKYKISDPNKYSAIAFSFEYLSVFVEGFICNLKETINKNKNIINRNIKI